MANGKVKISPSVLSTDTQFIRELERVINEPRDRCNLHEKRLDNFEGGQKENAEKIEKVIEQNITIFKFIERLDKAMFVGNGKPGVMTRIEMIENKHKDHVQDSKDSKNDKKFNITSIISILAILIMVIVTMWTVYRSEAKTEKEINKFKKEVLTALKVKP